MAHESDLQLQSQFERTFFRPDGTVKLEPFLLIQASLGRKVQGRGIVGASARCWGCPILNHSIAQFGFRFVQSGWVYGLPELEFGNVRARLEAALR